MLIRQPGSCQRAEPSIARRLFSNFCVTFLIAETQASHPTKRQRRFEFGRQQSGGAWLGILTDPCASF